MKFVVKKILLTAFEPYDRWTSNSSWLALVELTRFYSGAAELTTRRYPVELTEMSERLKKDLQQDFDYALLLGQSPGSPLIKLEAVGLNIRSDGSPLLAEAPAAYRSNLPLVQYHESLVRAGIPSSVSHHAGTYLCNAALYLSQHYASLFGMKTRSAFIHLPLTPEQVARDGNSLPSMSTPMTAAALAVILEALQ